MTTSSHGKRAAKLGLVASYLRELRQMAAPSSADVAVGPRRGGAETARPSGGANVSGDARPRSRTPVRAA